MDAVRVHKQLYNMTVYRYDYATGLTSHCNYFKSPVTRSEQWTITENPPIDMLGFFPSITMETVGYA